MTKKPVKCPLNPVVNSLDIKRMFIFFFLGRTSSTESPWKQFIEAIKEANKPIERDNWKRRLTLELNSERKNTLNLSSRALYFRPCGWMYLYVSVVIKDKSSLYAAWVRWFSPPSPPLHKTNKMFHFGTQIVREYKVQTVFNCYLCEKAVFQRPVLLTWLTLLLCPVGLREFSSHNENVRLQPHIRAEIYWVTEFMNTLKWDPHYFSPVYILVTFLFGAVSWDLSNI